MKTRISEAFEKIDQDTKFDNYHRKIAVLFRAACESGVIDEVCLTLDEALGRMIVTIADKCLASDQSQS